MVVDERGKLRLVVDIVVVCMLEALNIGGCTEGLVRMRRMMKTLTLLLESMEMGQRGPYHVSKRLGHLLQQCGIAYVGHSENDFLSEK